MPMLFVVLIAATFMVFSGRDAQRARSEVKAARAACQTEASK